MYELRPNKLGRLVFGIDLRDPKSDQFKENIIRDVREHRLLIFKQQGVLSAERHLEVSKWFGRIESTFFDHPKSPHRDVFRVSNDRNEGCTQVGRTGWHIDGSFQRHPFSHAVYHIIECPTLGETEFVPLTELLSSLPEDLRRYWDRLWMLSDRRDQESRPLVYRHPETKKPVLCFHLGMTEGFKLDDEKDLSSEECQKVLNDIYGQIEKNNRELVYTHKWEPGDFIISDNLSVGHQAAPSTQMSVDQVGLRVMHRVTVAGKTKPQK